MVFSFLDASCCLQSASWSFSSSLPPQSSLCISKNLTQTIFSIWTGQTKYLLAASSGKTCHRWSSSRSTKFCCNWSISPVWLNLMRPIACTKKRSTWSLSSTSISTCWLFQHSRSPRTQIWPIQSKARPQASGHSLRRKTTTLLRFLLNSILEITVRSL